MSVFEHPGEGPHSLGEVASAIDDLRGRVAAAAVEYGRPELAERLTGHAAGPVADDDGPYVVVVGEKKRGKSSLINALLGREGLLPVDVDIATACYIAVRGGSAQRAVALTEEVPAGIAIELGEVAEWASVEGNQDPHDPDLRLHEGVHGVEVTVDSPLLADGMVLVDTPGVGGLEAGHTELTLAALARADALLFVVDPGGPLTAPELAFLERASECVATVVFVLTKTDLYRGWKEVLDDDRALVARHAPRFAQATWIPVSAALAGDAVAAAAAGDSASARELRRQSGFDELAGALGRHVGAGVPVLRLENRLQAVASIVTELSIAEQRRLRAAGGDPRLVDELDAKEAALAALTADAARWPHDLQRGAAEVTSTLQREFQRRLRDTRHALVDGLRDRRSLDADGFTGEVDAILRAQWIELDTHRRRLIATLTAQLARQLSDEGFDGLARELPYPERLAALPPLNERPPDEQIMADYVPMVAVGSIVRTLGSTLGIGLLGGLPGLVIGLAVGHVVTNSRKERQEFERTRNDARGYLQRVFEEAAAEMSAELQSGLKSDHEAVEEHVRGLIAARESDLVWQLEGVRAAVEASESERAAIRAEGLVRVEAMRAAAKSGLALSARVAELRSRPDLSRALEHAS